MNLIRDMIQTPKKYLTLVGGALVMFTMGSENTLGTMSPYFMSYLREYDDIKSVRYSQTIWLYTINKVDMWQFFAKQAITYLFIMF
jgi:hypothetical protein